MNNVKNIENILLNIVSRYKNEKKRKEEVKNLISFVSKSSIFNGDKKKIYKLIKKYSK